MEENIGELISVIVPVYNTEAYLGRCIDSLLNQTYRNIEIIIVNDGSTDNSLKICQKYAGQNTNIILVNKVNEGVAKARADGIERAAGKWIAFVDSDDYLELDAYQKALEKATATDSKIVMFSDMTIRPSSVVYGDTIDSLCALQQLCSMEFPTAMWAGLYSKELLMNITLPPEIHFFEDFLFNYQVLHKVEKVALCQGKIYHYCINEGSINKQPLNPKRMSCIKIIPMIIDGGCLFDARLSENIDFCIAYFLISNITFLSLKNKDHHIFKDLKRSCKTYRRRIIVSDHVPLSYKLAILLTSFSTDIPALVFDMRKKN